MDYGGNSGSDRAALEKMRRPYLEKHQVLDSSKLELQSPFELWKAWFDQASQVISEMGSPNEPNQMALATATRDGKPSLRYLLLKGHDETGFYFYTNYNSRKGKELADNPRATVCMYWPEVHRMVTIEGDVAKVDSQRSDAYFKSRPLDSQIGAAISSQSSVIASRQELESARRSLSERVTAEGAECIDRPEQWGGYRLRPDRFEFWQGQRDRLHDRLQFRRQADGAGWTCERLAP
ncbi:hypothetical protein BOX15_Mlig021655g2 [Macrostomum lignano]|uniref:Pyridoxine-5'-phosphate oxidase n=2 Tax=Macrostomum lignano TaxID=282301 RepID=A0A1I8IY42_9PLAT|nr:hypothetical protein BOX15_Mlig021655g2 [Macrostomum lignano]